MGAVVLFKVLNSFLITLIDEAADVYGMGFLNAILSSSHDSSSFQ